MLFCTPIDDRLLSWRVLILSMKEFFVSYQRALFHAECAVLFIKSYHGISILHAFYQFYALLHYSFSTFFRESFFGYNTFFPY